MDGDLDGQDKESQEVSMLALHLLQSALVHVNTLLMQQVLADPKRADTLDMSSRLELDLGIRAATVPNPRMAKDETAAAPGL
jgi:hypothetical protein